MLQRERERSINVGAALTIQLTGPEQSIEDLQSVNMAWMRQVEVRSIIASLAMAAI